MFEQRTNFGLRRLLQGAYFIHRRALLSPSHASLAVDLVHGPSPPPTPISPRLSPLYMPSLSLFTRSPRTTTGPEPLLKTLLTRTEAGIAVGTDSLLCIRLEPYLRAWVAASIISEPEILVHVHALMRFLWCRRRGGNLRSRTCEPVPCVYTGTRLYDWPELRMECGVGLVLHVLVSGERIEVESGLS